MLKSVGFSVRDAVRRHIANDGKTWAHNRSDTVGASEIGQCARKVWYGKQSGSNAVAADDDYTETRGAMARGDLIENHLWVPAVRAAVAAAGGRLLFSGEDQTSLVDSYLSATPDGLAVDMPKDALAKHGIEDCGGLFLAECKSIDPRVDLKQEKSEHFAQVQVQLGLVRFATEYQPEYALISYIDASFVDNVEEFVVRFDPAIYENAKRRALSIMDATSPLALRPEGKMAGGKECKYCAWKSRCADETVAGVPTEKAQIGANLAARLEALALKASEESGLAKAHEASAAEAKEEIKELLRDARTRHAETDNVSVTWSTVKGRSATDLKAMEKAGVDLTPFIKVGEPSERLTIKFKEEDKVDG